ncbi:MAG: iron-containing alcohol dehydrogenase [Methylococcales bacterium]|jgi:alcohol dehydrogenase class IV|nr:iron-containing alcohol dehydrogenase [Methylococcales bacterium]MBT7444008.1 iron-containing alcohol dehydrogenase [Methylococcales bacterium]
MAFEGENLQGNWNYPTQISFGVGRVSGVVAACKSLSMTKPLLVTDEGLASIDFVQALHATCRQAGLGVGLFAKVKPNPTGANIAAGVAAYHAESHDGIIAIGGGSGLDAGKAIALMVGQSRPLWGFEDVGDNWLRVDEKGISPIIALPTTSGTGSEVGRASVIVDESTHQKKIIFHPKMLPGLVIADPALTVGLPPHITAATGIDAFVHCFEAYCAPGYHPMADGIALEGMRLIKTWLPEAYLDGENLAARAQLMVASTMGATAFQKGLGAVHALAHPLGGIFDKHHGLLNAILLPYVLQVNRPAIEDKVAHIGLVMGLKKANFSGFLDWVLQLRETLSIPHDLKSIGIDEVRQKDIGQLANQDPSAAGNPISFTSEQYSEIFCKAVNGDL